MRNQGSDVGKITNMKNESICVSAACENVSTLSAAISRFLLLSPPRFVIVPLQPRLHLVVGEKCHVSRVRHSQDLPVSQEARPGLKEPSKDVEFKVGDEVVAREVDGGLEGHRLEAGADRVHLGEGLAKVLPGDDGSGIENKRR